MSDETEAYGISIAGLDLVENKLGNDNPQTFFQQMCFERPDLARKLEYWCEYIRSEKTDLINVRTITYDLLQHVLDKFVGFDTSNQTIIKEE